VWRVARFNLPAKPASNACSARPLCVAAHWPPPHARARTALVDSLKCCMMGSRAVAMPASCARW
jgi:hypothetical protein